MLLAAEDTSHESYLEAVEVAAIVLVLYWLTHFYTHTLALRLRKGEVLTRRVVWRGFLYEFPVVEGAAVPLAALLVAWALGATVTLGVAAALWASIGTIVILEVMAVWRQRRHRRLCSSRRARGW